MSLVNQNIQISTKTRWTTLWKIIHTCMHRSMHTTAWYQKWVKIDGFSHLKKSLLGRSLEKCHFQSFNI